MSPNNAWCEVLGIERPDLGVVKDHHEANNYSCLIVALLERGEPLRLATDDGENVGGGITQEGTTESADPSVALGDCLPGPRWLPAMDRRQNLDGGGGGAQGVEVEAAG